MEGKFTLGIPGCNYVINCNIQPKFYKKEFYDVGLQSVLYNNICKQIEHVEKVTAAKKNSEKKTTTENKEEVKNDENKEEAEFDGMKKGFLNNNKGKKKKQSGKSKNKNKWQMENSIVIIKSRVNGLNHPLQQNPTGYKNIL